ncbi:hypothetical protein RDWZM_004887 [Blomia tropicalis]|uniref:Uncharacterized protein n=1 Tax=Blomia tropicalis TaxID=40697 RepID=A0A9Q0M4Q9_BLOTA|nr:hypothetical protein RDWZM_004887 [Blomia tropicalis]
MEIEIPLQTTVNFDVPMPIDIEESVNVSSSTVYSGIENAIDVENLSLSYGKTVKVLKDLKIKVPLGSIYGLLGPSGCGKTSLIRCILGVSEYDSGSVSVFGTKPGSRDSLIPGPDVGYMPQDTCLYSVLSIYETLQYFGRLYGLVNADLDRQAEFLISFLQLPDRDRLVGVLSGGQKRRLSLATALIHKPPLLILDEPTVGVDPLLRKAIWTLLTNLSLEHRVTVLITTHYIEEARDATIIGFMRDGRILANENPTSLLQSYNSTTLEQVFLEICCLDQQQQCRTIYRRYPLDAKDDVDDSVPELVQYRQRSPSSDSSGVAISPLQSIENVSEIQSEEKTTETTTRNRYESKPSANRKFERNPKRSRHMGLSMAQTTAMLNKNFVSLFRSVGYMLFQFFLPTAEVALFCLCIGRNLIGIEVAVFDGDQSLLSTNFLNDLNNYTLKLNHYSTEFDAINAVKSGHASSAVVISPNFSQCLHERLMMFGDVEDEVMFNSTVHVHPDMSNQLRIIAVSHEVLYSFVKVGKQYLRDLGASPNLLEMPITTEEPIYGHRQPSFTEFMAPGVILSITFLAAIPLTTMNLVVERKDGLIERTAVAGVSYFNILVSHLLCQTLILLVQVTFLMVMVFPIFQIPFHGEFVPIMLLTLTQSICGMSFGLLVSSVAKTENTATMLSLGAFYPMLLLSGTVWPIDAMNVYLQGFAKLLPQTIPIISMRHMIARGWNLLHWEVAQGFLVSFIWTGIFLVASTIIFSFRRK